MGIKKGDGQLDSLESPALPREDKERRDESGALSKSVHDGPDLVFTMTRIRCSRWAGFDVHDGPENATDGFLCPSIGFHHQDPHGVASHIRLEAETGQSERDDFQRVSQ